MHLFLRGTGLEAPKKLIDFRPWKSAINVSRGEPRPAGWEDERDRVTIRKMKICWTVEDYTKLSKTSVRE